MSNETILIKRKIKKQKTKSEQFWDNFEEWVAFWRSNPHRFAEFLGIHLHPFQKVLIYIMSFYPNFILWASRGLGKSWIVLVFCIIKAILYPTTKISVVAPNKNQSRLFVKKVYDLMRDCPNLAREILDVKSGQNETSIIFHNGSEIFTVVCSENARGIRSNILVVDEFAMVNKDIIDKIFRPFLTNKRTPPYLSNPEYEHLRNQEFNSQLYLSSIREKQEWSYKFFEEYIKDIVNEDQSYMTFSLPYQFGVETGIIDENLIKQQVKSSLDSPEIFRMEMECVPFGDSGSSAFTYKSLSNCRDNYKAFICKSDDEYIKYKDNPEKWTFYQEKLPNEIRLFCVDLAFIASKNNDNTSFHLIRLIPDGGKYKKIVSYAETMHGENSLIQTLRIKQLFYEFECDYCAMDVQGAGIGIYDIATKSTYDAPRGITYPAWDVVNREDVKMTERAYEENGVQVLYHVKTPPALLHEIIGISQNLFSAEDVSLLVDSQEAIEYLIKHYKYYKITDYDLQSRMLAPYVQTTAFINEAINLEKQQSGGYTKLVEKSGRRKDRVMSLLYGLYYATVLEARLGNSEDFDDLDLLCSYLV